MLNGLKKPGPFGLPIYAWLAGISALGLGIWFFWRSRSAAGSSSAPQGGMVQQGGVSGGSLIPYPYPVNNGVGVNNSGTGNTPVANANSQPGAPATFNPSGTGKSPATTYVIGTDPQPGGFGIYEWKTDIQNWVHMPGGAVEVWEDLTGAPWVVNNAGNIYRWNGSAWDLMPGQAELPTSTMASNAQAQAPITTPTQQQAANLDMLGGGVLRV